MEAVKTENDSKIIGDMKRRQMLKLGMLTAGVGAFLAMPKEAQAAGYATTPNVLNVKDYGALGDGIHDDTVGIQAAVTSAVNSGKFATVYFPPGTYKITNTISANYKTKGLIHRQGIKFKGDHAALFLAGPSDVWAFKVELDPYVTHDSFFEFEGFWFYTNNISRMNGIYSTYACYLTIQDCVFNQLWNGLYLSFGSNVRVSACDFFGCNKGAELYRCRDSLVFNSYAYASGEAGFFLHGIHDFGTDGAVRMEQCVALSSAKYGIRFVGVYTPIISNIISEHNNANLSVESCQYGSLSNLYSGPVDGANGLGLQFTLAPVAPDPAAGTSLSNLCWNIRGVTVQAETRFGNLQSSKVDGLISRVCGSSVNGAVVSIINSFEVEFNAILREIGPGVSMGLRVFSDCWGIKINGGYYEKKIKFDNGRTGNNIINAPQVQGDIEFEGSVRDGEAGTYFLKDALNPALEKHIAHNNVFPSNVVNVTLAAYESKDFSPATMVPDPGDYNMSLARFSVVGGGFGSFSAAEISVVRTKQRTQCTLVNDIGRIGSFYVQLASVSSNSDTIRLVNGAGNMQVSARVILLDLKVLKV